MATIEEQTIYRNEPTLTQACDLAEEQLVRAANIAEAFPNLTDESRPIVVAAVLQAIATNFLALRTV